MQILPNFSDKALTKTVFPIGFLQETNVEYNKRKAGEIAAYINSKFGGPNVTFAKVLKYIHERLAAYKRDVEDNVYIEMDAMTVMCKGNGAIFDVFAPTPRSLAFTVLDRVRTYFGRGDNESLDVTTDELAQALLHYGNTSEGRGPFK